MKIKKNILILIIVLVTILLVGIISVSMGIISLGDGYDYKNHFYNGKFCDYELNFKYCNIGEISGMSFSKMKSSAEWNEAYMSSNPDEFGEYKKHEGFDSYIGSNAWLITHGFGKYYDGQSNKECIWDIELTYLAAPADAIYNNNIWSNKNGEELGKKGPKEGMMLIKIFNNDTCYDFLDGIEYEAEVQS